MNIYAEALVANNDLTDQEREVWNVGVILDGVAAWAWGILEMIDQKHGKYGKIFS